MATVTTAVVPITESDLEAALKEIVHHGYGRVEIVVRHHEIAVLNAQKTFSRERGKKTP